MIIFTAIASLVSAAIAVLLLFQVRQGRKSSSKAIAELKRRFQDRESRAQKRLESAETRWHQVDDRLKRIDDRLSQVESRLEMLPPMMGEIKSIMPAAHVDASLHVVISLPKCGSSTIVATLAKAFYPAKVYHVHSLTKQGVELQTEQLPKTGTREERIGEGILNLVAARDARLAVEERRARLGSPVGYYVCGVRDPVAVAVSSFFQWGISGTGAPNWPQIRDTIVADCVLTESGIYTGGVSNWFDREIRDQLGIDIFSVPFDHSRGYQIYEHAGVRLLVIRQENFDGMERALGALYRCHDDTFETVSANRAIDKPVADFYREALGRLKFDEPTLTRAYSSRYARYFYDESERVAFWSKWAE
jgi:hypothetical protein